MNSPPEIANNYMELAIRKVKIPYLKMFILGIYGGFFISLAALCSLVCSYRMTGGDSRYYSGLVFPIGLMLSLCAGSELFSANCLLVIPLFCRKIFISEMLILWLLVYLGNLVGGFIMSLLIVYGHVGHLFDRGLAQLFVNTASSKTTMGFGDAFVKGILCNFCICLSVWISLGAKDLFSKIAALWTPILVFVACGFEHCVDEMFYIPAGLFASYEYHLTRVKLNWGRFFYKSLIPVTLGNICGGALLVGLGYWYIYLTPDSSDPIAPFDNRIPPVDTQIVKNNNINKDVNENK
jgi:formate/nitrite transporter